MDIEQLRIKGKELGIKQAMNMKEETLLKRIDKAMKDSELPRSDEHNNLLDAQLAEKFKERQSVIDSVSPTLKVEATKDDQKFFDQIGLKAEWLASIANQYDFNRFQYAPKFKAFRCYRGDDQIDWISVNDLGLLNVNKELTTILLKHQNHNPNKQVIKLSWRR